ncbi:Hypothetical predicted protein, partial [Marmota monax]
VRKQHYLGFYAGTGSEGSFSGTLGRGGIKPSCLGLLAHQASHLGQTDLQQSVHTVQEWR